MFTSITIFQVQAGMPSSASEIEAVLKDHPFHPTGPTQELSVGWVPPREENGALVESVDGQWIANMAMETRSVPSSAINDLVDERAAKIEEQTGRKPGKKERKSLKEEALLELLPKAFPKKSRTVIWLNKEKNWLIINSTSSSKTDQIITQLVRLLPNFTCSRVNTLASPLACMASWLEQKEAPGSLDFGNTLEMKAQDDTKASVKFGSHYLLGDEVGQHLAIGKMPVKMGLVWDGKVNFTLDGEMRLTKLKFAIDKEPADDSADFFDGSVAIETGELTALIDGLLESLGGQAPMPGITETPATAAAEAKHDVPGASAGDASAPWDTASSEDSSGDVSLADIQASASSLAESEVHA